MEFVNKVQTRKGKVTIAKGFKLWREVVIELSDYHGMNADVTVSWSDELRQLVVSRIDVRQPEGGDPITTEALRQIAVHQIARRSLIESVKSGLTPGGRVEIGQERAAFGLITREQVEQCRAAGPVSETLEWVALLYRAGFAMGDGPTKTVREVFGISQSTAGAWVGAARKQGYLGESEGPGKAGGLK
jgi:hypothetical protein